MSRELTLTKKIFESLQIITGLNGASPEVASVDRTIKSSPDLYALNIFCLASSSIRGTLLDTTFSEEFHLAVRTDLVAERINSLTKPAINTSHTMASQLLPLGKKQLYVMYRFYNCSWLIKTCK